MNHPFLKAGIIISFSTGVAAVIVRSIWYICDHPGLKALVLFIPLILALLLAVILVAYITLRPSLKALARLPVVIGITLISAGSLFSGIIHYVRFIGSPEAEYFISKVIASLILISCLIAAWVILWLLWSYWKKQNL